MRFEIERRKIEMFGLLLFQVGEQVVDLADADHFNVSLSRVGVVITRCPHPEDAVEVVLSRNSQSLFQGLFVHLFVSEMPTPPQVRENKVLGFFAGELEPLHIDHIYVESHVGLLRPCCKHYDRLVRGIEIQLVLKIRREHVRIDEFFAQKRGPSRDLVHRLPGDKLAVVLAVELQVLDQLFALDSNILALVHYGEAVIDELHHSLSVLAQEQVLCYFLGLIPLVPFFFDVWFILVLVLRRLQ